MVIGQAAEFDCSGTQAVRALREEGYRDGASSFGALEGRKVRHRSPELESIDAQAHRPAEHPLGSGPIVIGQAAESAYSGPQAVRALREEGAV
jgi:hypothetical protein